MNSLVDADLIDALYEPGASLDRSAAKQPRRSRQVMVYYHSGGDSMLFKLPEAIATCAPTYELKRSAVNAVLWCRAIASRGKVTGVGASAAAAAGIGERGYAYEAA